MSIDVSRKASDPLRNTIAALNTISRENNGKLWRDVAERLSGGRRRYASVDLGKIQRFSSEGDHVVVVGTVLGGGGLSKKVTISALWISKQAEAKLAESGSTFKTLLEAASENPKGTGIKVIR